MKFNDLEVVIMYTGEPTVEQCLESIRNQTCQPAKMRIIENVFPLSASINEYIRGMELAFSIKVDADMILYQNCIEVLYTRLKQVGKGYWAISAMLQDPFLDTIGGVHIQRAEYLRGIRVPNVIGCDRWLASKMKEKGYKHEEIGTLVGEHKSDNSLEAIFKRHVRVGQKHAYFMSAKYEDIVVKLRNKWIAGDQRAYVALLGHSYGLFIHDEEEKNKDYMDKEWGIVQRLLDKGVVPMLKEQRQ